MFEIDYNFSRVTEFAYLDSLLNKNTSVNEEMKIRIEKGNRSYFAKKNLMCYSL